MSFRAQREIPGGIATQTRIQFIERDIMQCSLGYLVLAALALGVAEADSTAYVVLLAAPGEEMDNMAETAFFPAVDALTPLE